MDGLAVGVIGETLGRILYLLPSVPSQVQIEITNECNLECVMCPRKTLGVPLRHMPFDLYRALVDRLAGVKKVTLTGWGEPFLHPQIYPMIETSKAKGFYTQLTTNGSVPEANPAKIIESGLDSITFSLDAIKGDTHAGHSNQTALTLIEDLAKRRQGKRPKITLQAILHKGRDQDIYDVISFGAEVGADRINLGRLDPRFTPVERPSLEEERTMLRTADKLGRCLNIQVDIIQYALASGVNRFLYRFIKGALHQFGRYCLKTYNYLYINIEGEVTPCCMLPNYGVGNVIKEDLRDIWKGESFRYFRKKMGAICGQCDLWRISYIDQEDKP